LVHSISFENSVQDAEAAIVLIEFEVVEIVEVWFLEAGKCVVRVHGHGAEVDVGDVHPDGERVRAQQDGPQTHRQHVGENVFDWVRVGGRNGQGSRPLVVFLVEALVEPPVVQHPD